MGAARDGLGGQTERSQSALPSFLVVTHLNLVLFILLLLCFFLCVAGNPWLALVIDPLHSLHKDKPEIKVLVNFALLPCYCLFSFLFISQKLSFSFFIPFDLLFFCTEGLPNFRN